MRFGDHPGFSRVVFDWTAPVSYSLTQTRGEVRVSFQVPVRIDASLLRNYGARLVLGLETSVGRRSTEVVLRVPPNISVTHFLVGAKVVIDLAEAAPKTTKPNENSNDRARSRSEDSASDQGASGRSNAATVADAKPVEPPAISISEPKRPPAVEPIDDLDNAITLLTHDLVEAAPAPRSPIQSVPPAPDQTDSPQKVETQRPPTDAKVGEPKSAPPIADAGPPSPVSDDRSRTSSIRHPAAPAAPMERVTAEPLAPATAVTLATGSASELRLRLSESVDELSLEFTWPAPVPAAVFERSGYVWVVFAKHAEADLLGLNGVDSALVSIEQLAHPEATVLRLQFRAGVFVSMDREQATWRLLAAPERGGPSTNIAIVRQTNADGGARLFLPVIDTGARVEIEDPEIGDALVVVPIQPGGFGVAATRNFAQLRVLASQQGVVIEPRLDDLAVAALRNGVAISADDEIALSDGEVVREARKRSKIEEPSQAPLLAIADWRHAFSKAFHPQKQILQRAVAEAPKAGRNIARWELAKFFFANDFMTDGLAVLELMKDQDAAAASDPVYRAMRGVISVLLNRAEDAAADLQNADLDRYPDARLWRGLMLVAEGKLAAANQALAAAAPALTLMPEDWRRRLLFDWAEAAVAANDDNSLRIVEELLSDLEIPLARRGQLEYLKGQAAERRQEPDVAIAYYDQVIDGGARRARIRAAVARVNLLLESGDLDRDHAVEALVEMSHAWRGDGHEVDLVGRLADLRLGAKDYSSALKLMRRIINTYPNRPDAEARAQRLNEVFRTLFLDGAADEMSPVSALALFYDFQELTPVGDEGDVIIGKLADRLVQVELLDRAARLLEQQVGRRLKDSERARVATRLALIYLMDRRPKEAVEILKKSRGAGMSAVLRLERRHLMARALADLGRDSEALSLLDGDQTRGAELMRSELAWRRQDWPTVASVSARVLGTRWQRREPLGEDEAVQVIKRAVALNLANELEALKTLKVRYGALMSASAHAETFNVLSHKVEPSKTDFRKLASAIAGIGELEAFMSSYRARVAKDGLATIN